MTADPFPRAEQPPFSPVSSSRRGKATVSATYFFAADGKRYLRHGVARGKARRTPVCVTRRRSMQPVTRRFIDRTPGREATKRRVIGFMDRRKAQQSMGRPSDPLGSPQPMIRAGENTVTKWSALRTRGYHVPKSGSALTNRNTVMRVR